MSKRQTAEPTRIVRQKPTAIQAKRRIHVGSPCRISQHTKTRCWPAASDKSLAVPVALDSGLPRTAPAVRLEIVQRPLARPRLAVGRRPAENRAQFVQ